MEKGARREGEREKNKESTSGLRKKGKKKKVVSGKEKKGRKNKEKERGRGKYFLKSFQLKK